MYMGGCQNYGPFLGALNTRCRITLRTQNGTIVLTTTHIQTDNIQIQMHVYLYMYTYRL